MQYDPFQQEAIDYIDQGLSVIVSAPTGAGKTAIAEHVISSSIEKDLNVIYTAPIKALSNQKFRDFQERFGSDIGILTGDVSLNPDARVLIMTTEIFRNKILDDIESLRKYSWIIFDEVHYLDNQERGTVWEESLMFLPPHMNCLCLSATIPNIKQLASWIATIHRRPVKTVIEEKRPVPLHFLFHYQNEVVDSLAALKRLAPGRPNKMPTLVNYVRQQQGFPCIYFVFGRRRAEELSQELAGQNFLNAKEREQILSLYEELCSRFDLKNERSAQELYSLVQRGIAYHHAGMLPTLKEVIERLFTSRLLKIIFTTETFALGINMPSRSVIFDGLQKFYGRYVRILKTRDFYQMAGRAGRRGMDKEGFVYCRFNPRRTSLEELKRIIYGPPEEVHSQLNTSYATILNLYEKHGRGLLSIYPASLHYFQSKKHERDDALRLMENKLALLERSGYIDKERLTEKGQFAKVVYGYELLLSELYEDMLLEQLDEFGLGIMACAVVFEPRKNQSPPSLSKAGRRVRSCCEEVYAAIRQTELKHRVHPLSKPAYFHLTGCVEAWLRGTAFDKILRFTDTDEGEVIRYFRMGVQILRQVHDAPVVSHLLRERIKETIRIINRGVVDAEKQLREG